MIVDTHVHVIADDVQKYPKRLKGPSGQQPWPDLTGEMLIQAMDENGIDRALTVQAYWTYECDNSYAIDVALKYPRRFQSVAVLDPRKPGTADELSELVKTRAVRGLRFMRVADDLYRDPRTIAVVQRLQSLNIPLCLARVDTAQMPDLAAMLERFPDVQIALDHSWSGALDKEEPKSYFKPLMEFSRYPNLFLKIAPNISHDLRDRKMDPRPFWDMLIGHYGANRLMWGSNYPAHWHIYGKIRERLAIMQEDFSYLGEEERKWIFGEAALRLWPTLR